MRKIIGIGETVLDIIFDGQNKPVSGRPGGSVYNALISLGRCGVKATFISEVGDDRVGGIITSFLEENHVDTDCVFVHGGMKSPLALAFLDENKNAQYSFYKDYKGQKLELKMPDINEDDIVLFGSYFALNSVLRAEVASFLKTAKAKGAILYYDVNFRPSHRHEVNDLLPVINENFDLADIVKGSDEDFEVMFGTTDWRSAYHSNVESHCKAFICTQGSKGATFIYGNKEISVAGQKITPVSTVGAGDSFNAGTLYGMMKHNIAQGQISDAEAMSKAMSYGVMFATEVCQSLDNYVASNPDSEPLPIDESLYASTLNAMYAKYPAFHHVGAKALNVGLENSEKMAEWLGNPHRAYKTIHVAGTNGKGSTSHSIASVLQSAGYKVGLYTSPHLVDFRERIRVNGQMIDKRSVVDFLAKAEQMESSTGVKPSFFEITTMMAFDYFMQQHVDVAVIEVGLGGRLDSTNIISPCLSVITNIGLEHTDILGDTVAKIAYEKGGIIKENTPVVIGEHGKESDAVFVNLAVQKDAPLTFAQERRAVMFSEIDNGMLGLTLERLDGTRQSVLYGLSSPCQEKNILTVMAAIDILRASGDFSITIDQEYDGLKKVVKQTGIMGRWQKIASSPDIRIDTGHNLHGVTLLALQLEAEMKNYDNVHIIWGMVNDKKPENVLPILPKGAKYYFVAPNTERAVPSERIAEIGKNNGLDGQTYQTIESAVVEAKKNAGANDLIFIGGSNFVVGDALIFLQKSLVL